MFGLHERHQAYQCIISKKHINQDIKRRLVKLRTQQYIELNNGANEIQQVNPGGPDNSPTISSIDKSLSRYRHGV